jgi:integrase
VVNGYTEDHRPRWSTKMHYGSKTEAQRALAEYVVEVGVPTKADGPGGETMNAYLDRWIEHYASQGNSPVTVQNYRSTVNAHLKPVLGKHRLKNLTTKHVADLDTQLQKAKKSPGTRRQIRVVLSAALTHAEESLGIKNVARLAGKVSNVNYESDLPDIPTTKEVKRIIKGGYAISTLVGDILTVAANTGARRAEICGLKFRDWDIKTHQLRIDGNIKQVNGWQDGPTKTRRSIRTLLLAPECEEALYSRLSDAKDKLEEMGKDEYPDDWYIFALPSNAGAVPYKPGNLTKRFSDACTKAGITNGYVLHSLRHWNITEQLSARVPVNVVATRVGGDPAMVMRVYAHYIPSQDEEAAATVGALLR